MRGPTTTLAAIVAVLAVSEVAASPVFKALYHHGIAKAKNSSTAREEIPEAMAESDPKDSQYSLTLQKYFAFLEKRDAEENKRAALVQAVTDKAAKGVKGVEADLKSDDYVNTSHAYKALHARGERVLFVIYSDSQFYDTRLKWVHDTWASTWPASNILVIGDKPQERTEGQLEVLATQCPPHSHWEGACCKYAEAVVEADRRLAQDPTFKWAFFSDDDAYLRPGAFQVELSLHPKSQGPGSVVGTWGCGTELCPNGLCAGGGYGASSEALRALVGASSAGFLREQMRHCQRCDRWADVALSRIFDDRGLERRPQPGLYGWKLSKEQFDQTLADAEHPPLLYHYIQTKDQMEVLDALFRGPANATRAELVSRAAAWGFDDDQTYRCATFGRTAACARGASENFTPWVKVSMLSEFDALALMR